MTFESMTGGSSNVEAVAVKVSKGDEIRRASFSGGAYVALHELIAKLFELDQAAFVLKYQDEDGDKITVSSDGEVVEALQLSKEKKLLRLFVELKPQQAPKVEDQVPVPHTHEPIGAHIGRGGLHHAHGPHGPHAHWPHRGFHGHGGFRGGFGRGGFGMRGGFAPHGRFGQCSPADSAAAHAPVPQACDPSANFHTPQMFAHGIFSPANGCPFPKDGNGPYAARCAFKEHKRAMKENLKLMKMNASTAEDLEALKDFKQQMKAECKARWHALKDAKKDARKDKKCEKSDKYNRPHAKHVADVTIPDNSELAADTPVTKTWRLRNEGNVAWPADSQLIFVSRKGDNLNGPERVFVGPVEPQQEVDVSVTFITPSEPGRYVGFYRMANADGVKFGQRVWVAFLIAAGSNPVPAAQGVKAAPSAPADVNMD